jgi:chorismate dehydratase
MQKINVSAISYSNSVTFLYGLLNSEILEDINLSLDIPSVCADRVLNGTADIGLIPIVETLRLPSYEIVSDYCIGADDYVRTVLLTSNSPIEEITRVFLDYQSRTSVVLVKVLAQRLWKKDIEWVSATKGFENLPLKKGEGAVIIGDRAFSANHPYQYDLAHEWKLLTGLPFVFAAWVSNKKLSDDFKKKFNDALTYGLERVDEAVAYFKLRNKTDADIASYLRNNINYPFDENKRKAKQLFLEYARQYVKA